jgi:hypothetical protein
MKKKMLLAIEAIRVASTYIMISNVNVLREQEEKSGKIVIIFHLHTVKGAARAYTHNPLTHIKVFC